MSKVEDVVAGSQWVRPGQPERVLTVLEVWAPGSPEAIKWGGLTVKYRTTARSGDGLATPEQIVEWGEPVGSTHDIPIAYQPKGLRACHRCKEVWPMVAKAPGECKPSTDPRPPQVVIEEKVAALMARGA
jgi:hypothetical protein